MEFKPGEKAKLVLPASLPPPVTQWVRAYFGTEVTVLTGLLPVETIFGGVAYSIVTHDGKKLYAHPRCLERPQPPKEKTGSWEHCPFAEQITAPKKRPVEAPSA